MASLGNYMHDFPRLAEQSGFEFQLHRGTVNWSDIENLNVQEIIETKNFQLLQENLINVINCNLEREFDLNNLNENFVKLFRIAQLGIDYLSYCELYLDKCVILLQEKLANSEKECQFLRQQKTKKKNKDQHFQCEKCEKIFISEIYLKYHEKRRHSPKSKCLEESLRKPIEECQPVENVLKMSTSTQTLVIKQDKTKVEKEQNEASVNTQEKNLKIENIEEEMNKIKNRLEKAESALIEKSDGIHMNLPFPFGLQTPIFYSSLLPYIPSHLPVAGNSYSGINQVENSSVQEENQLFSSNASKETDSAKMEPSKSIALNSVKDFQSQSEMNEKKLIHEKLTQDSSMDLQCKHPERNNEMQEELDDEKENINLNAVREMKSSFVPVPFPRKMKKVLGEAASNKKEIVAKPLMEVTTNIPNLQRMDSVIEPGDSDSREKNIILNEECLNDKSNRSLFTSIKVEEELASTEQKSNSFIRKMMVESSPRLLEFKKNLKKSFTNLYDSVSSSNRDLNKEQIEGNPKAVKMSLNVTSAEPTSKEMTEQKVKESKHWKKFMENSGTGKSYGIFKKLRRAQRIFGSKKNVLNKSINQPVEIPAQVIQDGGRNEENDDSPVRESLMYDLESDSESEISDLKTPRNPIEKLTEIKNEEKLSEVETNERESEKEFDFSVFQVGKGKKSMISIKRNVKDSPESSKIENRISKIVNVNANESISSSDDESIKNRLRFGIFGSDTRHDRNPKSPQAETVERYLFGNRSEEVELIEMNDSNGSKSHLFKKNYTWSEDSDWDG